MWWLLLVAIALVSWATVLFFPWIRPDPSLPPPKPGDEAADKAKRTGGRMAAVIILAVLGIVLAIVGVTIGPGTGQCNADGQCTTPLPTTQIIP
jgi:hypothetical protein